MKHRNLTDAVDDLEKHGHLVRVSHPVDPHLEMAEIQRRLYARRGPAVLFTNPKNTRFPMLANLYGSVERMHFLFRSTLAGVRRLVDLKIDPSRALKQPWKYLGLPLQLYRLLPKRVGRNSPILQHTIPLNELPQLKCWPMDGGAFVTLPGVYSEHPAKPGWRNSNLGMYRVQISGNDFDPRSEVGIHYQIHRGIGVHHAAAQAKGQRLPVNVIVAGHPALPVSAVMPLPEGLPELAFAGALMGYRMPLAMAANGLPMPANADFVLSGYIETHRTKPEGPFGDHLGYYSLVHDFPVMTVEQVYHRPGAIWGFTVVGRPPQEDTSFGEFIHDLTGPVIPTVLPGVKGVHAVDAAGVHPLLLAIGSERYVPYAKEREPQELLTIANAILGQGQLSLAKVLLIVAKEDDPELDVHDIPAMLKHLLLRVNWQRDLHFQTSTTIDTLDYSAGEGLNRGSKLIIAAAGSVKRELGTAVPGDMRLSADFPDVRVALPGVLCISGPKHTGLGSGEYEPYFTKLSDQLQATSFQLQAFPLVCLVDDAGFSARTLNNWLWSVFTRINPAADALVVGGRTFRKHHGGPGPLVFDARWKPHMAPPLVEEAETSRRVDALASRGGPLHGLIG